MPYNILLCVNNYKENIGLNELLIMFKEWPIIVQGALGSGLFWLTLRIGQLSYSQSLKLWSLHSKKSRRSWLISQINKYEGGLSKSYEQATYKASILVYRSLRHLYRAIMWLVLGFAANLIIFPLGIVGFIGALHYLFKAYEGVSPIDTKENVEEILKNMNEELEELKNI